MNVYLEFWRLKVSPLIPGFDKKVKPDAVQSAWHLGFIKVPSLCLHPIGLISRLENEPHTVCFIRESEVDKVSEPCCLAICVYFA